MKIHPQELEGLTRLGRALAGQQVGMLTLSEPSRNLSSRPLLPLEMDGDGRIWLFVSRRALQPLLGARSEAANLSFCDERRSLFVSITGKAALATDAARKAALWALPARPWFVPGPSDPDLGLLRVTPLRAEVWDGAHSTLIQLAAMAAPTPTPQLAPALGT